MKKVIGSVLFSILSVTALYADNAPDKKPNILIIYTDDMGYGDISAFGDEVKTKTPQIDKLAKEGLKFTQYYTASPICSPSRAALLTGQFPSRVRLNSYLQTRDGNRKADQNDFLDAASPVTFPKLLKQAGYATAHIGKWHLGGGRDVDNAPSILKYGYDLSISTWESPEPYPALGVKYAPWDKRLEDGQVQRYRRTEFMVDKTLEFFDKHTTSPVMVTLWPDDMHTPYRPSPELQKKYKTDPDADEGYGNFMAVLEEYDKQIGRLISELDKRGLSNDTIIIFTADNGPAPHYDHRRNPGMRGMKLSLYEGGIRLPFIVRWSGKTRVNQSDDKTILSSVDLYPSLLKLANVEIPKEIKDKIDGEDMSGALLGKPKDRDKVLLWEYGRRTKGAIPRPKRLNDISPNLAARKGDLKLLINDDGTSAQLYNVVKDRGEKHNIIEKHKAMADELTSTVIRWQKTMPHRNQP